MRMPPRRRSVLAELMAASDALQKSSDRPSYGLSLALLGHVEASARRFLVPCVTTPEKRARPERTTAAAAPPAPRAHAQAQTQATTGAAPEPTSPAPPALGSRTHSPGLRVVSREAGTHHPTRAPRRPPSPLSRLPCPRTTTATTPGRCTPCGPSTLPIPSTTPSTASSDSTSFACSLARFSLLQRVHTVTPCVRPCTSHANVVRPRTTSDEDAPHAEWREVELAVLKDRRGNVDEPGLEQGGVHAEEQGGGGGGSDDDGDEGAEVPRWEYRVRWREIGRERCCLPSRADMSEAEMTVRGMSAMTQKRRALNRSMGSASTMTSYVSG